MKIIIDTNILFSALYNLNSNAGDLFVLAAYNKIELYAPEFTKEELIRIVKDKLHYSDKEISYSIAALPVTWIEQEIYSLNLERAKEYIDHIADIPVVACSLTLNFDIVSGDTHFHPLKKEGPKVWKLKELLDNIRRKS